MEVDRGNVREGGGWNVFTIDELTAKGVVRSLGGSTHDPTDPVGRLLFNVLGMVAEFEADLIRMRTREGMAVAKAKGRLAISRASERERAKRTSLVTTSVFPARLAAIASRSPGRTRFAPLSP